MPRFDWDQEAAVIRFSSPARNAQVVADIQFIGTLSSTSGTWMWAWANESLEDNVKHEVLDVQKFGKFNGLDELVQPSWSATEEAAWDMTCLSCYVLRSQGAYRAPDSNKESFSFLSLRHFRRERSA